MKGELTLIKSLKILVSTLFLTALILPVVITRVVHSQTGNDAPSGFDNVTNDFEDQATFDADRQAFENQDKIADGLGPVYNAQSCAECHQNPVSGGIRQITELRAGRNDASGHFVAAPGGSLIQSRAINPKIQERTPDAGQLVFGATINNLRESYHWIGDINRSEHQRQLTTRGSTMKRLLSRRRVE